DHFELAKFGRPAQRRRTNVFIPRVKVSAVSNENLRLFHFAFSGELVQRRSAQPIRLAWIEAVLKQQFVQFPRFRPNRPTGKLNALGQVRLVTQHQVHEGFVAFSGGVGKGFGIVGQRRVRRENGGGGVNVAVIGQQTHSARRAI